MTGLYGKISEGRGLRISVKTELPRLISSLLYGSVLLGFCWSLIDPWTLRENNALVSVANQNACYIGYKRKPYRGIDADLIVYIFAHLHTTLRTEENSLRCILNPGN